MQKSKTDVPQKDLSVVGTDPKASLFLQFPIGKKVIRIGAPKKKKFALFTILNLFVNGRDCGRDHCFLNCSRTNPVNSDRPYGALPQGERAGKHPAVLFQEDSLSFP